MQRLSPWTFTGDFRRIRTIVSASTVLEIERPLQDVSSK